MTPTEIETAARRKYNAIGDTFWSSEEIQGYMFDACMELAREAFLIETIYTTTTVAGTEEYSLPTNTIGIKRITYDGKKLHPISRREDDTITGLNESDTTQGTPRYYKLWNESVALRPIPDSAKTLKIFSYNEPSSISTTSTLEIPTLFHHAVINFVVSEMAAKDLNFNASQFYQAKFLKGLEDAKKWQKKRKRTDAFSSVIDEELAMDNFLGII